MKKVLWLCTALFISTTASAQQTWEGRYAKSCTSEDAMKPSFVVAEKSLLSLKQGQQQRYARIADTSKTEQIPQGMQLVQVLNFEKNDVFIYEKDEKYWLSLNGKSAPRQLLQQCLKSPK